MKVLVTGAGGFAGKHLLEFLLSRKGVHVFGALGPRKETDRNLGLFEKRGVSFFKCDIRDARCVRDLIRKVKPGRIFHLAGQSSAARSWDLPEDTFAVNVIGTLNLFEAVRRLGLGVWIQVAGSSEQYGLVPRRETPAVETTPLRPLSPYGVSKASQDLLAYQYGRNFGLKIVRTCSFNHTGPGQREDFVVSSFAKQVALIEAGKQEPVIHVGNLEAVRDFMDVRDVVKAYWLSLEKGAPGERYHVASGTGRSLKDVVSFYLKESPVHIKIKKDPVRARAYDVPVMIGNASKFRRKTGWKPAISFEKTLLDVLNHWRDKINA